MASVFTLNEVGSRVHVLVVTLARHHNKSTTEKGGEIGRGLVSGEGWYA